jgi:cell division protein FtsI/penicillin-binding protein 2
LAKKDLARYLGARLIDEKDPRFLTALGPDQDQLIAETTLDPKLQDQANQWLAKTRASQAALVVMNPLDGQVLTLAGYRRDGAPLNAALTDPLPAASLFKIITATAAMEKADYEANTLVAYDGGKHTLYRGNVLKKPDVGRHKTTLKEGFADSNNAVFGKLGAFDLGSEELVTYANRFYFNQPIDFEMKWEPSEFSLAQEEEDLFRLAEIASGYNRETKATALHGAMLAATVIAEGVMMEPTLVREAFDKDNKILYRSQAKSLGQVMSPQTAKELSELMEAAVSLGTGRRHFWDAESHPLLSGLVIGGKSGTMNDEEGRRVEWFVAYSYWPEPNSGPMWPLALAAVVANEGKTAPDSQELIRRALIAYYQPLLDGTGRVYK